MKKLIIVESPSKAKTIQKYLGGDVTVMASAGHICDLPERTLAIDVDHGFEPQYIVNPGKADIVKKLVAAVGKNDIVYLATDPDREGEAISWHLKTRLGIKDEKVRVEFNEISPKAVKEALEHPRAINQNLVDSQQARRVLDRLVGYKLSPILGRRIAGAKSAGRVQSAALKMIVDRENEIRNFVPKEYWNIAVLLVKAGMAKTKANMFKASLNDYGGDKVKVEDGGVAEEIAKLLPTAAYSVDSVKKSVSTSRPAPPFTTSTLQQEANNKLNMTSERTMSLAQKLYEGFNVPGEGHFALITYMRTDSVRVSPDFQKKTLDFIYKNYGNAYVPKTPNVYKTSDNAQDAHEAIRPISLDRTPQSLEGKISNELYRLYKLIYERYLASQMAVALYNTLQVHVVAKTGGKDVGFIIKGKSVKFNGFTAVYTATATQSDEEKDERDDLPAFEKGDKLDYCDTVKEQKFTKPPARYTDATLVKGLEENGIGRPSTYASIVIKLADRTYTERQGKNIVPTELGERVCTFMEQNCPSIMNLSFTARLETKLDEIAEGKMVWNSLVGSYYPILEGYVERAYKAGGSAPKRPVVETDEICEKCGSKMVIREGRYGKFMSCSAYPKCKNVKNIAEKAGVCPKCGGDIEKRMSKSGKTFYGCNNYPKCDFVTWDTPAPHLCPKCKSFMKVSNRNYKKKYVCTNADCKFVEEVEE